MQKKVSASIIEPKYEIKRQRSKSEIETIYDLVKSPQNNNLNKKGVK